jgi:hypothetical protein
MLDPGMLERNTKEVSPPSSNVLIEKVDKELCVAADSIFAGSLLFLAAHPNVIPVSRSSSRSEVERRREASWREGLWLRLICFFYQADLYFNLTILGLGPKRHGKCKSPHRWKTVAEKRRSVDLIWSKARVYPSLRFARVRRARPTIPLFRGGATSLGWPRREEVHGWVTQRYLKEPVGNFPRS